jgi:hypothetical protein
MGIAHENEKVIGHGYVVDIYIPPSALPASSWARSPTFLGTVLEFDGPSHFETYVNAPLGPTVMKRRHLEALGYAVTSLPYWKYHLDDTPQQKQHILREALSQASV